MERKRRFKSTPVYAFNSVIQQLRMTGLICKCV